MILDYSIQFYPCVAQHQSIFWDGEMEDQKESEVLEW